MNFRLASLFLAGIASIFLPFTISIAKPNVRKPVIVSNTLNLGNGIKFAFHGCTQISNQDKVVCSGIFRNSSGEKPVLIGRVDDNNVPATSITNKNSILDFVILT